MNDDEALNAFTVFRKVQNTHQLINHLQCLLDRCHDLENVEIPSMQEGGQELESTNLSYREMVKALLQQQKEQEMQHQRLKEALDDRVVDMKAEQEKEVTLCNDMIHHLKGDLTKKERNLQDVQHTLRKLEAALQNARAKQGDLLQRMADKSRRQLFTLFSHNFDQEGTKTREFLSSEPPGLKDFISALGKPGVPLAPSALPISRALSTPSSKCMSLSQARPTMLMPRQLPPMEFVSPGIAEPLSAANLQLLQRPEPQPQAIPDGTSDAATVAATCGE